MKQLDDLPEKSVVERLPWWMGWPGVVFIALVVLGLVLTPLLTVRTTFARDLASTLEPIDVLDRVVRAARQTLRADSAYIDEVTADRSEIVVVAAEGCGGSVLGQREPFSGSFVEEAAATPHVLLLRDLQKDPSRLRTAPSAWTVNAKSLFPIPEPASPRIRWRRSSNSTGGPIALPAVRAWASAWPFPAALSKIMAERSM